MTRSTWKGPFSAASLSRRKFKGIGKHKYINSLFEIHSRNSLVLPQFIGHKIGIHNGQKLAIIRIKEEMVGHKFGEFSFTRKRTIHKKKLKK